MKTIKYIVLLIFLTLYVGCVDEKFKDEFQISLIPDAVVSKVTIDVVNANGGNEPISGTISFEGEGAEYIYSPEGNKDFVINDGIITVGVLSGANPTEHEPLNVLATIVADGYEDKMFELSFTGEDVFKYVKTLMVKEGELPSGVEKINVSTQLDNGVTTEDISLNSNISSDEVSITIPKGATITDDEGNLITDSDVSFEMVTYDLSNEGAINGLDEGGFIREDEHLEDGHSENESRLTATANTSVIDAAGDVILPISNVTSFYLRTSRSRRSYRTWYRHCYRRWWSRRCHYHYYYRYYYYTVPARIRKYINANTINPISGTTIKAGDAVNVYKNQGGTYRNIGSAYIRGSGDRLYVDYSTYWDGTYLFGFSPTQSNCAVDASTTLTLSNNSNPQTFKFTVSRSWGSYEWTYSKTSLYVEGSKTINLQNELSLYRTLSYLRYNNMVLKIYDGNDKKVFDKPISMCDVIGGTINLDNSSDCVYNANLDVSINCPSVNIVLKYLPVFYKKTTDTYYSRYGYIHKGYIKGLTPCLEDNESYQFRFLYNGEWKVSPQKTGGEIKSSTSIGFDSTNICNYVEGLNN